mgnify:CR=1 FL=1
MNSKNFDEAAQAVMAGNASIEQINTWFNHDLRCAGPELMESLVKQMIVEKKRAEDIELKAVLLVDKLHRGDIEFKTSTAVCVEALGRSLADSRLRATD